MNISKTVRYRAILSKFLTHRVVQDYPMPSGKISFSNMFYIGLQYLMEWRGKFNEYKKIKFHRKTDPYEKLFLGLPFGGLYTQV